MNVHHVHKHFLLGKSRWSKVVELVDRPVIIHPFGVVSYETVIADDELLTVSLQISWCRWWFPPTYCLSHAEENVVAHGHLYPSPLQLYIG